LEDSWSSGPGNIGQESEILSALMASQDQDQDQDQASRNGGEPHTVDDLKLALEGLERRKRVRDVATLPAALNELAYLNAYVDELHGKLRKSVREIEKSSVRSIKAKIQVREKEKEWEILRILRILKS